MIKINLEKMVDISKGCLTHKIDISPTNIQIDSRKVSGDDYFMPILGEVHDGHKFIVSAFDNGVKIAFCEKAYYYSHQAVLKDLPLILVDNTTRVMHRISRYILKETGVRTVGITGSVGKTSTKEFVYHALKGRFKVHKNKGNFNNHIGMPLTIFDLDYDHDIAILEMGMNHFKEIEVLADIARPEVAVITNIGTSHIGILGSRENIFQAKMEIASYLESEDTLIINMDDDFLPTIGQTDFKVVRVHEDLKVSQEVMKVDGAYTYTLNDQYHVDLNVLGKHNITNSMLAIGVANAFGVETQIACQGISDYVDSNKRLEVLEGRKQSIIINDCYNASQESMMAAIEVLENYKAKKIAVLGDVLELGDYAQTSHESVGEFIVDHPVDYLMTFGSDSKYIIDKAQALGYTGDVNHYDNIDDLYEALEALMSDSVILVKGSFGMGMSRIVEYLGGRHDS